MTRDGIIFGEFMMTALVKADISSRDSGFIDDVESFANDLDAVDESPSQLLTLEIKSALLKFVERSRS